MASEYDTALGAADLGAAVLARLASARVTGRLVHQHPTGSATMLFRGGRPESFTAEDGTRVSERAPVAQGLRRLALAGHGRVEFVPEDVRIAESLGIDTLGETLVALMQSLTPEQAKTFLEARADMAVESSPLFPRLVAAVTKLGGAGVVAPAGTATLAALSRGAVPEAAKTLVVLVSLGALVPPAPPRTAAAATSNAPATAGNGTSAPTPTPTPAPAPVAAPAAKSELASELDKWAHVLRAPPPADPRAREAAVEIATALKRALGQDCYAVLGVKRDATPEVVRKAYFDLAKRWHSDRFGGLDLGPFAKGAEELFRMIDEAQRTLIDPKKREEYDFVLDRKAKGLPTDVAVIMEAENLFRTGETYVRRGQADAAEPLLRRAVAMNKGEPEFLAWLGFAIYGARGTAGLLEARDALQQALKANEKMDVAYEFLGKIARAEGELVVAQRELKKALQLNPKNHEAERELRLVQMRQQKAKDEPAQGLVGKLGKFFKKE